MSDVAEQPEDDATPDAEVEAELTTEEEIDASERADNADRQWFDFLRIFVSEHAGGYQVETGCELSDPSDAVSRARDRAIVAACDAMAKIARHVGNRFDPPAEFTIDVSRCGRG